ncbi:ubiquinone biosynthesis O-methyltransferase, partial [Rhizodiscina lignyota]
STKSSSVDESEISHFNALAASWWDPNGSSRILHAMNPIRQDFIKRCRSLYPPPGYSHQSKLHYLDIGCGGGIFAESAARLRDTASVTAIDPSPEVLAVAKQHARRDPLLLEPGRLTYLNTSIEGLAETLEAQGVVQQDRQYDIVTLFEVLEHVAYPSSFLEKMLPYVKPGGWLVLSTISRTWPAWFVTKFMAEEVLKMVPRGTHEWEKYVKPDELRQWFRKLDGQGEEELGRLGRWSEPVVMEVMYVPGLGWREVGGGGKGIEGLGNYFFGVRRE